MRVALRSIFNSNFQISNQFSTFIIFSGYSCSCSPFECVCGLQTMSYHQTMQQHQQAMSYHQEQPVGADSSFWMQDSLPSDEGTLGYCLPSQVAQEAASYPDFPSLTNDLFQPEEIFQLDQPIRTDFALTAGHQQDLARSPPTLLDLGSGSIKYETRENNVRQEEQQQQVYWKQFLSEDSSSNLSVQQDDKLHMPGFDPSKELSYQNKRHCPELDKNGNQNFCYPENQRYYNGNNNYSKEQREFEGARGSEDNYWGQVDFSSFDGAAAKDACQRRSEDNCYTTTPVYHQKAGINSVVQDQLNRSPLEGNIPTFAANNINGYHRAAADPQEAAKTLANRGVLDDRLAGFEASSEIDSSLQESFFYPGNERCRYTCQVLDTRLNQIPSQEIDNSTAYSDVSNIELPTFVDYTLVGMFCGPNEESSPSGILGQDQQYIQHH